MFETYFELMTTTGFGSNLLLLGTVATVLTTIIKNGRKNGNRNITK